MSLACIIETNYVTVAITGRLMVAEIHQKANKTYLLIAVNKFMSKLYISRYVISF